MCIVERIFKEVQMVMEFSERINGWIRDWEFNFFDASNFTPGQLKPDLRLRLELHYTGSALSLLISLLLFFA